MDREIFVTYIIPIIMAIFTAIAGWLGVQIKALCQRYLDNKTKRDVARTCVKAVEQLYYDLSGPEKLKKAQEGIVAMLQEKGIPISELEMNTLIESVVCEFNHGAGIGELLALPEADQTAEPCYEAPVYTEEEGASE